MKTPLELEDTQLDSVHEPLVGLVDQQRHNGGTASPATAP